MELDDLLDGKEAEIEDWLREKNLLHECNCGYKVYDVDEVNGAVQDEWGDKRCEDIYQWACDLSNRYGWMWIESSSPKHGIYHCQYCAESELSLLSDLEKIADGACATEEDGSAATAPVVETGKGPCVVYVDESYSDQYPRKAGGSLSFGALIIPESSVDKVSRGVEAIIQKCYHGSRPEELKYTRISKRPGLLDRVGREVAELIKSIPDSAVIGIYVPQSGLFGERLRALRAVGHYSRQPPTEEELTAVESTEAVEAAVRDTTNQIAHTIASCVGSYLGSRNLSGRIVFDPRSRRADEPLIKVLEEILPKTPINAPLIMHQDRVVTVWPGPGMDVLGDRLKIEICGTSHETPGLQLADFLAGDIRTYFEEVPELLSEATGDEPLVNKNVLFPQLFRHSILTDATRKKSMAKGRSALPLYRERLANGNIAAYTINGQMRNIDLKRGAVYDIMD
jgi:hypothetical protein